MFSLHRLLPTLAVGGTPGIACATKDAVVVTGVQKSATLLPGRPAAPKNLKPYAGEQSLKTTAVNVRNAIPFSSNRKCQLLLVSLLAK